MGHIIELVENVWEVETDAHANHLNDPDAQDWRRTHGWIPISIDAYRVGAFPSGTEERYVVVWRNVGDNAKPPGPLAWKARFGISRSSLEFYDDLWRSDDEPYDPWRVAVANNYSLVSQKRAPHQMSFLVFVDNEGNLGEVHEPYRLIHAALRWAAIYYVSGDPRYALIYHLDSDRPYPVKWTATTALSWNELQKQKKAFWRHELQRAAGGVRPAHIAVRDVSAESPGSRYFGIWHSDHVGPHDVVAVSKANLEALLVVAAQSGFFPYGLSIGTRVDPLGGTGPYGIKVPITHTTCAVLFQQTDNPIQRTLRIRRLSWFPGDLAIIHGIDDAPAEPVDDSVGQSGPTGGTRPGGGRRPAPDDETVSEEASDASSEPTPPLTPAEQAIKALDDFMIDYMKLHNIRAGSLAIANDEKLVFASAYTWAEPDYPTTLPTSAFRFMSVAKTFTSTGIFRLIDQGKFAWDSKLVDIERFGGAGKIEFKKKNGADSPLKDLWAQLRIRDLLTMSVLWKKNDQKDSGLPVSEVAMAQDLQATPPLDKGQFVQYLAGLGDILQNPRDAPRYYTNENHLLLAHVIEEVTFQPYHDWMKQNIWLNIGIAQTDIDNQRIDIVHRDPLAGC